VAHHVFRPYSSSTSVPINVTALGIADSIEGFNVQISRLFHVLRVGYEIRPFLGVSSIRTQTEQFYKSN
jgi:hypothetical protein